MLLKLGIRPLHMWKDIVRIDPVLIRGKENLAKLQLTKTGTQGTNARKLRLHKLGSIESDDLNPRYPMNISSGSQLWRISRNLFNAPSLITCAQNTLVSTN